MTNGSGPLGNKYADFAAYEWLRDSAAKRALQNFPINVGAETMRHFTRKYAYWECKEQVEQWVLSELKRVVREQWTHEHPILEAKQLPNNDLCDRGKQASRRRLSASLRLAKRFAKIYGRGPLPSDRAVAQNAGKVARIISRLRGADPDNGRRYDCF